MEDSKMTYDAAMKRLEEIVANVESGKMNIDTLGESLKEAKSLVAFCRERLTKVNDEITKILSED
jgi:exodeoxyribonuclease VII small subunit